MADACPNCERPLSPSARHCEYGWTPPRPPPEIVLVGEANPYSPDPRWALYDEPRGVTDAVRSAEIERQVRTRSWYGRPDRYQSRHPPAGLGFLPNAPKLYRDLTDRAYGLRYARLLARVLRVAHREGIPLTVQRLT